MLGQFITYITQAGDRWDTLAWRFYGDPMLFGPIIQLNPLVPIDPVFNAGTTIGIPILLIDKSVQQNADLPPWKRNS